MLSPGTLALMIPLLGAIAAQTTPVGHVSIQPAPVGSEVPKMWMQQVIAGLDPGKLRPIVAGSWENQLVDADRQAERALLRRDLSGAISFYTFTANNVDTLVARWNNVNPAGPEKAIWLWDTQDRTAYVLQIDPAILNSGGFAQYCENLLVWDKRPIKLGSLQLYYPAPDASGQRVFGRGVHEQQELGLLSWGFEALSTQGVAYVAVVASKPFFRGSFPREAVIPERFPPLKLRLAGVPRNTLLDELGKGYRAPALVTYPSDRDQVLLAELLSRGPLTDQEIYQIILGPFDHAESGLVVNQRVISFLDALQERNEVPLYAAALERFCYSARTDGGLQVYAIGNLLGAMAHNHIDFSNAALTFVARDQATRISLSYLERFACGAKAVQALSGITVKPEFEKDKQYALVQMRARCK